MGRFSITSETALSQPREVVYDFATNPNNWGRTYKGSGGMNHDIKVPIEPGMSIFFGEWAGMGADAEASSAMPFVNMYNRLCLD